jgi:hypothetical protein
MVIRGLCEASGESMATTVSAPGGRGHTPPPPVQPAPATPAEMKAAIQKARKIGWLMLIGGVVSFLGMVTELASSGKTDTGLIFLAMELPVIGLGTLYDPRALIALSSRMLFPAHVKARLPPEAKRLGYLFAGIGGALFVFVCIALFQ